MQPVDSLRERKKHETSRAISHAALTLAALYGPGAVTVEEIADAANVSPRTVFNYFPTKEAAILGVDLERRREMVQQIQDRPTSETPLEAILGATRDIFTPEQAERWRTRAALSRDHPQLHSAYLASFSSFEADLTDAIARRTGLDPTIDLYPKLVVAIATSVIRVAVGRALLDPGAPTIAACLDTAFSLIADGMPVPTPRETC